MPINKEFMTQIALKNGIEITDEQNEKLNTYADLLVEWNEKINLTAITDSKEIAVKHFLDSILLLKAIEIPYGATLIDVGTGAGFPSVPCKIMRSDIELTLLDSLNKRINFLTELCSEIGEKAQFVHSRAEDGARTPALREQFDFATARAVAQLRTLAEYCLPYVKVGGYFVALKGGECAQEIAEAKKAIGTMGAKIEKICHYDIAGYGKRSIILIKKHKPTPKGFPRNPAQIAKKPII